MVSSIYDSAAGRLLLTGLGGAWCVRVVISSSTAALPRASWWNTAVVHARPFWSQDHEARETTRGSSHKDRAERIR